MNEIAFDILRGLGRITIGLFLSLIGRKDLDKKLDKKEYGCMSFILGSIVGMAILFGIVYLILFFG